jgi:hypothetical protein
MLALAALPAPAAAQPVGSEFQVNTYTTGSQIFPDVAPDANGGFVVVWESSDGHDQDGDGRGLFGQRYDSAGAALGGEFQVNSYTTSDQRAGSVDSDASGNVVVVWESAGQDGSLKGIFGQRYDSSGEALGSEFLVNTYTTLHQLNPSVACDASGAFIVVWASAAGGINNAIFGQRYDSGGVARGAEFRVSAAGYPGNPSVASAATGDFVVVWTRTSLSQVSEIAGQRYDSQGIPQGSEFVVSPEAYHAFQSAVASHTSGNFVVVWASSYPPGGSPLGVFGQRYDSEGTALGPPFPVGRCKHLPGAPSVATDVEGNVVVAWQCRGDGNEAGVFGRRYDSQGNAQGDAFQINSFTTAAQRYPSIAATDVSQFVVAWESSTQDGSGYGVFGRRHDFVAMHMGDLDGRAKDVAASWRAQVTTRVHDDAHSPLGGVLVTLDVSGVGARTCTTTTSGGCEVSVVVTDSVPSLTFTVTNLTKAGFTYNPGANHDPDPDSNGTMIVVNQP